MYEPIRVVICTRHTLLREGIKAMLAHEGTSEVAGEAITAKEAVSAAQEALPPMSFSWIPAPGYKRFGSHPPYEGRLSRYQGVDSRAGRGCVLIADCVRAGASGYIGNADKPTHLKDCNQWLVPAGTFVFMPLRMLQAERG